MDTKERRSSVVSAAGKRRFQQELLNWYARNRRDLPWRIDHDPYRIWVSEIMLQQTRVAAVLEHYRRFLLRFPTVKKLAAAREASVLAVWSGLGYYRRARMLHAAAKAITRAHAAGFPRSAKALRGLPGVGRYTAAAIASIAFGESVAAVDGNVERVLRRMSGSNLTTEEVWRAAAILLHRARPGDFNQAMMELGATVCLPRQPRCPVCPVFDFCASRGKPAKITKPAQQKKHEIHYVLACRNGAVFLAQRRKRASLMPGMWELPEIPAAPGKSGTWITLRHSITVTDYIVQVVRSSPPEKSQGQWVSRERVGRLPLTGLARKILRAAEII